MKLKIVGLKKSVQSRIMITGIHTTPLYIEGIGDDNKESIKKFLYKINFGISDEWDETECMTTAAHGSTHVIDGEADVIFNKYGLFIYDLVIDKVLRNWSSIALFNSLNRAPKEHRNKHVLWLEEHNLVKDNLVSGLGHYVDVQSPGDVTAPFDVSRPDYGGAWTCEVASSSAFPPWTRFRWF